MGVNLSASAPNLDSYTSVDAGAMEDEIFEMENFEVCTCTN